MLIILLSKMFILWCFWYNTVGIKSPFLPSHHGFKKGPNVRENPLPGPSEPVSVNHPIRMQMRRWGEGAESKDSVTSSVNSDPVSPAKHALCRKGQRKSETEGNTQHRQHPQLEFSILTNIQIQWNAWPSDTWLGRVRASQDQTDRGADKDGLCHPTRLELCVSTGALLSAWMSATFC